MICLLSGPVHSGKTTLLRKLLFGPETRRFLVSGYLSLMVLNEGKVAGYDLFRLKDGDSTPFLRTEGEAGWQRVGPYFFLPRGLEVATAAILGCKPGEILVVDEVGPAELAGRGVWLALSEVIAKHSVDCLLVVRKTLLEGLRRRIRREPVRVFDIERRDVYQSLLRSLSQWKVPEGSRAHGDASAGQKGRSRS